MKTEKKGRSPDALLKRERVKNRKLQEEIARLTTAMARKEGHIFELIKRNEELEELIEIDPLTQVRNRRGLENRMTELKSQFHPPDAKTKRREGVFEHITVIAADIDHFKDVNDTYGHDVGDQILKLVAGSITSIIFDHPRKSDVVARVKHEEEASNGYVARTGGEEFTILLPGTPVEEVVKRLVDVRHPLFRHLAMTAHIEGKEIRVTVSAGITEYRHPEPLSEILKRADRALYKAKLDRNKVVVSRE